MIFKIYFHLHLQISLFFFLLKKKKNRIVVVESNLTVTKCQNQKLNHLSSYLHPETDTVCEFVTAYLDI